MVLRVEGCIVFAACEPGGPSPIPHGHCVDGWLTDLINVFSLIDIMVDNELCYLCL